MKCLRCGHCCKHFWVQIVDDLTLEIDEGNVITHEGDGTSCKHLEGNKPGEYACKIHDYPWYKETPCFSHGQIESSPDNVCRLGEFILKNLAEK